MSIINTFLRNTARPNKKQLVCAGIFAVAFAGSVGAGIAARGYTSAAVQRDCSHNSIDFKDLNGGCGAANPQEYIADLRANDPSDLHAIAQNFSPDFHLATAQYDDFAAHAVQGMAHKNGTVTVGNQTVVTNAFSIGRDHKSHDTQYDIPGTPVSYWAAKNQDVFSQDDIPAMVYFNAQGEVQFIAMNPCGNLSGGTKVTNSVTCKALNSTQPDATHKPNTYNFTTSASVAGNAAISRVVYHFSDDNSTVTKNSVTDVVSHTFTKDADVTVTVYANVPGGHEIQAAAVVNCKKHVKFVLPFFVCTNLLATAIDNQKKSFRFTVMVKTDSTGATVLKNVDFTLDNKTTTSGVTTKDAQGNVYKEYTFTDEVQHSIKASANFNTAQGVQSATCQASVTPAKIPKCTVPGHENEAPNSPTCGYCQPNVPIGDTRCTPPPTPPTTPPEQLINTGPGSTVGLFGAVTIAGFFAHKFFVSRRMRDAATEATPAL